MHISQSNPPAPAKVRSDLINWAPIEAPYNQEAEEAVLGAILVNPTYYADVTQFLDGEDFFILRHRYIWEAMTRMQERGDKIDTLTLAADLRDHKQLGDIGGPAYLTQLVNNTPTSVHAVFYGRIVESASTRRKLMSLADTIKGIALNTEQTVSEAVTEIDKHYLSVLERATGQNTKTMREAAGEFYDQIERRLNGEEGHGLMTGITDLDNLINGMEAEELIILAGRPGMGKTAAMLTFALNMAKKGIRAAYFSMEMATGQITSRLVSMESRINSVALRTGKLNPWQVSLFHESLSDLQKLPLLIDDGGSWTPHQLRAKCAQLVRRQGVQVVFVDYLQLMNGGERYKDNKTAEVTYISRKLKEMARELGIPVCLASQLNRAVESRQDKRPNLADLRDSGAIEQDADKVMFLYRDEVYNEATEFPNQAEIIVAKQRNGPTGTITCAYEKTITRFLNAQQRRVDLSFSGRNEVPASHYSHKGD